ncbi:hypothetical protein QCN29_00465 [Streptomyces sp. HNM0663]|uniref:Uncharacterized protein n=1 Tax=Streptomyces chengmaiensis TaxID=3040919 RepID=A0ABT6HEU2_9ACTN|nr:hypothetical protein [Streptomyces chengmaiensis]MDH2387282.1 hypothetical protein [Streptomyces chengmaiensis]
MQRVQQNGRVPGVAGRCEAGQQNPGGRRRTVQRMYDGSTGKQYTPRAPPGPWPAARIPERRMRGAFAADVKWTNIAMAAC